MLGPFSGVPRMSQTLQILNRMIEEMELAIIKAKAQLEYSADEAMIKLGYEEEDAISGDMMRDE
mgnify:CR=1 FL=1